jgi:hypothetical protein|nr:MAG TPA: Transcriptional repressor CTCF/DNA Complex factor zinc finger protein-DNA [Caudoviricetes sp.]
MHEIKAYQCAYCRKYSKSKSVMKKHESKCFHNPITKACATCGNRFQEHYKVEKLFVPFVGDVYAYRPVCKAGKIITELRDGELSVNQRDNCEYWIKKEEEE